MPVPPLYAAVLALLPEILGTAQEFHQDPWTMAAIVFAESRGLSSVVKYEQDGSCSVGLAGINVPGCDAAAVAHLLLSQANLRAEAILLSKGDAYCHAHKTAVCRRGGAVALYNAGDRKYAARIRAIAKTIRLVARRRTSGPARAVRATS